MSREANSSRCRIVALGPSSGSRLNSFVRACVDYSGRPPAVLSWQDFLQAPDRLGALLDANTYLRIDTPDRDIGSLTAVYRAGRPHTLAAGHATLQDDELASLAGGAIGSPAQFASGMAEGIKSAARIAGTHGAAVSCSVADVALAFDKTASQRMLRAAGVPTPRPLPGIAGWDALVAAMESARMSRVFVKLRYGSAASGMMAIARNGAEWMAMTTAMLGDDGVLRATKDVRRLNNRLELAQIVDRLAPLGLHCEEWLPKIGVAGRTADVRVVMVGDDVIPVLRLSRHPMTNLHLDGDRGSPEPLIRRIGETAWCEAIASARKAAGCYPGLQTAGVDVVIQADGRRHAVLEVNAFGDYIKHVAVRGLDSQQMQVRHIDALMLRRSSGLVESAA